jgi:UDP-N-acetylmuramate--alanine ligase
MEYLGNIKKLHLVGIGGAGMSAIARLLLATGCNVSGSDCSWSSVIEDLRAEGAEIRIGHDASALQDAEGVVYSSAIPPDNPELLEAQKRNLPVVHRAEMLSELMRFRRVIAVTGTHGKTTTAGLIAWVLYDSGLEPMAALGAELRDPESNALTGAGDLFVAEADESDRSLLRLHPIWAVVTNIDTDHLDEYLEMEALVDTFIRFMNSVPFFGKAFVCLDDDRLEEAIRKVHRPVVTYGVSQRCDFSARKIRAAGLQTCYNLFRGEECLGEVTLGLSGEHNVLNSLAAAAACMEVGVDFQKVTESLSTFPGVKRRQEWKGTVRDIWVFDDYGHHPSEIKVTLKSLKALGRRLVTVFQPHRFTRTRLLMNELSECFENTDELYLLDVYSAGESPIAKADSRTLAGLISRIRQVRYVNPGERLINMLQDSLQPGDLLLTMGAGDVWKVGEEFLKHG